MYSNSFSFLISLSHFTRKEEEERRKEERKEKKKGRKTGKQKKAGKAGVDGKNGNDQPKNGNLIVAKGKGVINDLNPLIVIMIFTP